MSAATATDTNEPLIVLVSDRKSGAQTLAILRDWVAVGWIRPFLWVNTDDEPVAGRAAALDVRPDSARPTSVESYLSDSAGAIRTRIRVCAFDCLTGAPVLPLAQTVAQLLKSASPTGQVTRIHLLAATVGMVAERPFEGTDGWHRVALSPEERFSPTSPADPVLTTDDPIDVAMHFAAGLAGFTGLWSDIPESPLDRQKYASGTTSVVLGRTFLRRVDAEPATRAMQNELTDISAGLPRPVRNGTALNYFDDEYAAVRDASRALLAHYDWLLAGQRVTPPPPDRKPIRFIQGMRLFFSFIWAALRNAPRDWLNRTIADGESWMARMGQALIGKDSEYLLVVRGRRADGSLAPLQQVDQAVGKVRGDKQSAYREDLPRLGLLWRDFIEVGLGLVDGGHRVTSLAQPTIESLPGVVRNPRYVAVPADEAFTDIPAHVAAELQVASIHPADLYLSDVVLRELDERARASTAGLELRRVREKLSHWRDNVQRRSFAGDFGAQLGERIMALREEIAQLQATLAKLVTPSGVDTEFALRQQKLARRTQILIWCGLLVPLALTVARWLDWITAGAALLLAALAFGVWALLLVLMFVIGQARLFQLLNRQDSDRKAAEAARANLAAALSDLDRVLYAYESYRHWAAILGSVVVRPFGPPTPDQPGLHILTGPLPRNVAVGSIVPTPQTLREVAAALRPRVFVTGWLDTSYQVLQGTAASTVATANLKGGQRVEALYAELSRRDSDALSRLAELVGTRGVGDSARQRFWESAAELLAEPEMSDVRAELLQNVTWSGDRQAETAAITDESSQSGRPSIGFAGELLTADARAERALIVDNSRTVRLAGPGSGLGQNLSVTEFGHSFTAEGLDLRTSDLRTSDLHTSDLRTSDLRTSAWAGEATKPRQDHSNASSGRESDSDAGSSRRILGQSGRRL